VPPFPHESLTKRHSGVSVAEITFSAMGAVTRIDVLEAPDEWIARSMRDTLQKWRLPEARQGGQPIGISAKVTYYFVIEGAIGKVLDPLQAPLARKRPPGSKRQAALSSLSNSVNGGLLKTPSGRNQNGASW
jgi:Gram-negative bacterial TonB protein C-terminal